MFNLYTPELLTLEHNLRVAPVERYGWLLSEASGNRVVSRLGALMNLIWRLNAFRFASARTGQAQGAA